MRDERGMTLIELVVTMALATTTLLFIYSGFDSFVSSAKTGEQSSQAQDSARRAVDQIVHQLRQARVPAGQTSPIPNSWTVSRSDLVAASYITSAVNATAGTTPGWVRYCASTVGTSTSLIAGVRAGNAYAAPGPCVAGDTTNGWSQVKLVDGRLLDPGKLFDYQSTTCIGASCTPPAGDVRTVGVRVAVGTQSAGVVSTKQHSVVRDAVSFRNRS